MKLLLLIFFLCLTNLLIGQKAKPIDISGIGEIRFDRTLDESKRWLEKEIKFDSSCNNYNYNSYSNPCTRTFTIKKHISGVSWQRAIAIYYNDKLIEIDIDSPDSKFLEVFELKYGKSDTTELREMKNIKTRVSEEIWKFNNADVSNRISVFGDNKNVSHHFTIESKNEAKKLKTLLENCKDGAVKRAKIRCEEKLIKKFKNF